MKVQQPRESELQLANLSSISFPRQSKSTLLLLLSLVIFMMAIGEISRPASSFRVKWDGLRSPVSKFLSFMAITMQKAN